MECTKKAQVQVSTSGSDIQLLCFRHAFLYVKMLIKRLGSYNFGIYIQRPPQKQRSYVRRELTPEAKENLSDNVQRAIEEDWNF